MHPSDEELDRVLSGEAGGENVDLLVHLSRCPPCAGRLEELRDQADEISRRLRMLDHPVPAVSARALMRRRHRSVPLRGVLAASIALVLVSVGAFAFPRSPLHQWMMRQMGRTAAPAVAVPAGPSNGSAPPLGRGLAIEVTGPTQVIFVSPQVHGQLRIRIGRTSVLSIRDSGAEGAAYSLSPRGIRIDNRGATGDFELVIPRDARDVEVRVGSRIVFAYSSGSAVADSTGVYAVPLSSEKRGALR